MFPADPGALCGRSVCVVGGAGEDVTPRAREWQGRGCAVQVLPTALAVSDGAFSVADVHGGPADHADRVRLVLQRLGDVDLVEFPVAGGLGFRAIQAKRARLAFAGTTLVARLDGCGPWWRARERRWPNGADDLQRDYLERYTFENACARLTPAPEVLDHVLRLGWAAWGEPVGLSRRDEPGGSPLVSVCVPHFNLGRFLPQTLASIEEQTYPGVEVLVIDDGSTEAASAEVFEQMRRRHPRFRFVRQSNVGIGATRNRGLAEARGDYFVPVDADNVLRPEFVERLVTGIGGRPDVAALTCGFLAFHEEADLERGRFAYACRPTGGPHVLGCLRNVYGDACAIYRTAALRGVGGYEEDRGTSFEDWEAFVKLVNAGHRVDVLPEHLFYYRHRETGFSRVTDVHANHERVVRQYRRLEGLPAAERAALWDALVGLHRRGERPARSLVGRLAARMREWWAGRPARRSLERMR